VLKRSVTAKLRATGFTRKKLGLGDGITAPPEHIPPTVTRDPNPYEAGIFTYRQLASLSPEVLKMIIDEPEWRSRSIDAASWIEQAKLLTAQREKVETRR